MESEVKVTGLKCDKNIEKKKIIDYNMIKIIPEMFDTLVILNLHD